MYVRVCHVEISPGGVWMCASVCLFPYMQGVCVGRCEFCRSPAGWIVCFLRGAATKFSLLALFPNLSFILTAVYTASTSRTIRQV